MFAKKKRNFHLPMSSSMKRKIIDSQWGYTTPKIPALANFVNSNYPEWNMQIEAKSKWNQGRVKNRIRMGTGTHKKGYEISVTKNGKELFFFDTTYLYKNKDVARYIAKEIIGEN